MNRRAGAVLTACFSTVFIAYAIRYGYGMLLPAMLPALAISKAQAGVIYASYFAAYTICSPVLGLLSDRYSARLLLTVFTTILAAGALLMAFASSVLSASIFFAVAGIGHAACWTPVVALVQRWVSDRRRGLALALTTMGSGLGIATWGLLLPTIVRDGHWQRGWLALGFFGLAVAGLNFILVRNPAPGASVQQIAPPRSKERSFFKRVYLPLLKHPTLWIIGLSYLLVGFTVLVPYTFISAYAVEELRLSYTVATRLVAVMAIAGMAGKLVLGPLSDRIGRVPVMMGCGALLAAGCGGLALFKALPALYGFAALFGIGFGAVWPLYAAAAPDYFAKQAAGSVIGLWTVFLGLGSILSPVVCGIIIDLTGTCRWALAAGTVSGLGAALTLIAVRATAGSDGRSACPHAP